MIAFKQSLPVADTMVFEQEFEEQLRLAPEDKIPILANGIAAWLLVDGELAGETYGITPRALAIVAEEIEDADPEDDASMYCYSTAILPAYRGRGLAKLLKAHWLGRVNERGYSRIIGHSTSPEMQKINRDFGSHDLIRHERWYDTNLVAVFYEILLSDATTIAQSPGDCGPAAIEYMLRSTGRVSPGRKALCHAGGTTDRDGTSYKGMGEVLSACGLSSAVHAGPITETPLLSVPL